MSKDTWEMLLAAAVALSQIYYTDPGKLNVMAALWARLAKLFGELSHLFDVFRAQALRNYYMAVMP